jgi:hypothetical protein
MRCGRRLGRRINERRLVSSCEKLARNHTGSMEDSSDFSNELRAMFDCSLYCGTCSGPYD